MGEWRSVGMLRNYANCLLGIRRGSDVGRQTVRRECLKLRWRRRCARLRRQPCYRSRSLLGSSSPRKQSRQARHRQAAKGESEAGIQPYK